MVDSSGVILLALALFAFVSRFYMPEPGVSRVGTWKVSVHMIAGFMLGAAFPFGDETRWLCGVIFAVLLVLEITKFPYTTRGVGRKW